jgi:hypothetical protein
MNHVSRFIAGAVLLAFGLFIIHSTIVASEAGWELVWGVAWGSLLCGIAAYLFLNRSEDEIEEIKRKDD